MITQVAMAEEFQVCSGNWWNSPRNLFGSSPCSWAVNDIGNLEWPSTCNELMMDMSNTVISSDDSAGSASDGSCTTPPEAPKTHPQISNGSLSMSTGCWNQDFLHESGRSGENYSQIMNYRQENWINSKNFCEDLSSTNPFKQVNQDFSMQHQPLNSTANTIESCAATCEEISFDFPMNSSSYSYASTLMQTLLGQDNSQPPVLSFLDDQKMNYSSESNYMNSNELLASTLPKYSSMAITPSRQKPANHLPISNNTRFWNATASSLSNDSSNFIPSTNSQILPSIHNNIKNSIPNISTAKYHEEARDVASVAKKQNSSEPAFKRPRIETPSPLPTFKVRKEKLGDRITALQQLVSPFGKTDTASVLHEAIEYIKFLHDQVKVLGTPYLKNGPPPPQHQQAAKKPKDREGLKQDLKSRGLCLVPISSTFPVAAETTSDFWTHTFGVSFR